MSGQWICRQHKRKRIDIHAHSNELMSSGGNLCNSILRLFIVYPENILGIEFFFSRNKFMWEQLAVAVYTMVTKNLQG